MRDRASWLPMFGLLAAAAVLLALALYPLELRVTLDHLPTTATPDDRAHVAATLDAGLSVRCAFVPVRLFVGWGSCALVVFLVCRALGPAVPLRFDHVLCAEVHAETATMLGSAAVLARSLVGLPAGDGGALLPPFRLSDVIPSAAGTPVHLLLSSANIFTLWYVVTLGAALSVLCGFRQRTGLAVSFCVWLAGETMNAGILSLLIDRMRFLHP
jgi:hypothetical protein